MTWPDTRRDRVEGDSPMLTARRRDAHTPAPSDAPADAVVAPPGTGSGFGTVSLPAGGPLVTTPTTSAARPLVQAARATGPGATTQQRAAATKTPTKTAGETGGEPPVPKTHGLGPRLLSYSMGPAA